MDSSKIGNFIKERRAVMNLTQRDVADKLMVTRENISKWERGLAVPNTEYLRKLCEVLDVSIYELLAGELIDKNNKEKVSNIIFKIMDENKSTKLKMLITFFSIIFVLIILFLVYYFFNNYNSISVYTITGESENYIIEEGLLFTSKEKNYFIINQPKSNLNEDIKTITLYYMEDDEKQLIMKSDKLTNYIASNNGTKTFFNSKKILKENLYLELETESTTETIKLDIRKDYSNSSLTNKIYKEEIKSATESDNIETNDNKDSVPAMAHTTSESILDKLQYDSNEDKYYFEGELNGIEVKIEYDTEPLYIMVEEENSERWIIYGDGNKHINYFIGDSQKIMYNLDTKTCYLDGCDKYSNKIDYFVTNYYEKIVEN